VAVAGVADRQDWPVDRTWRRAQIVLLSPQGMDAAGIAKVAFASPG
jgi:hypothetical protein